MGSLTALEAQGFTELSAALLARAITIKERFRPRTSVDHASRAEAAESARIRSEVPKTFGPTFREMASPEFNPSDRSSVKEQILLLLRDSLGGLTAEEICNAFPNVRYSTITARVTELAKLGIIRSVGMRPTLYSGRPAKIWVLNRETVN